MWLLKSFFMILVIALGLAFAFLNFDETVNLRFLPSRHAVLEEVPVVYALLAAFLLGVIVWYLASFFHILRIHIRMERVQRETVRLEAELLELKAREAEVEAEVERAEREAKMKLPRIFPPRKPK